MKIVFVSSPNGLGHARRLLHLIPSFISAKNKIYLLITKRQYMVLSEDLHNLKIEVILIGNYGLDGLLIDPSINILKIPKTISELISTADLVFSDNSLWPAKYATSFYLLGHFDWVTHFLHSSSDYLKTAPNIDLLEQVVIKELDLTKNIIQWFQTRDFILTPSFDVLSTKIPLLRYSTDNFLGKYRQNETWFAQGTTGRNFESKLLNPLNFTKALKKETWQISLHKSAPLLVVGRPGLGTIRDCFASATCFYPLWTGYDLELDNNVKVLHRFNFGLDFTKVSTRDETLVYLQTISEKMKQYWTDYSSTSNKVAKLILDSIG